MFTKCTITFVKDPYMCIHAAVRYIYICICIYNENINVRNL